MELDCRLVLDVFADAVVIADRSGGVVYINSAGEKLLDWPAGDLIGQPLAAIIPPRLQAIHRQGFGRYLTTGEAKLIGHAVRVPARRRDGTEIEVELTLTAFHLDGDDLFVASLRDISERVELERRVAASAELEAANRELERQQGERARLLALERKARAEAEAALETTRVALDHSRRAGEVKSNFLRLLSHELRNPLNSLHLQIQRLQRGSDAAPSARQQEIVRKMAGSSARLLEMIESLLEYARIESGRLTTHIEPLDLAALAAEVVDELRPQAELKRLELRFAPEAELPPLQSDRRLVRLILVNLVDNAVKYTERGSVDLSLSYRDGAHRLAVTDTGPGIASDRQARIFEPFEHLEPVSHKHTPGVGLGLALVREVVEALGGRIELRSQVGAGSTFTVILPAIAEERTRSTAQGRG